MPLVIKVYAAAGTTLDRAVRDAIGIAIVNFCMVDLCFGDRLIRVGVISCPETVITEALGTNVPEAV